MKWMKQEIKKKIDEIKRYYYLATIILPTLTPEKVMAERRLGFKRKITLDSVCFKQFMPFMSLNYYLKTQ